MCCAVAWPEGGGGGGGGGAGGGGGGGGVDFKLVGFNQAAGLVSSLRHHSSFV